MTETCFHCCEPVPAGCHLSVLLDGEERPMCCLGCQAVAELIIHGGDDYYYRFREGSAMRVDPRELERLDQWRAFDHDHSVDESGLATASVLVEGMHCGACAWLIETRLGRLEGMHTVDVDVPCGVATLRWRPDQLMLSEALGRLVQLGFVPHPLEAAAAQDAQRRERNNLLRRLAVGGLGMMQVMMLAVGTYAGALRGIDPAIERLLLGVSMLIATPVVFYAGAPFLVGAWRAVQSRTLSMDVPVALALLLAYGASCLHFFAGSGTTYFESVSMFVFFLLCSRFIAMLVRHRSLDAHLALAPMLPDVAQRLDGDTVTFVPRRALKPGDLVRVRAGDALPADGTVVSGHANVNEALLSGEAQAVAKGPGDDVLAGSLSIDGSVTVRVSAGDADSTVARIASTLSQARGSRPLRARLAEKLASRFVIAILFLAAVVGAAWWQIDPSRAFAIVLAVLVVTCPCALSLAMPTALSAAATQLARNGLLVHRLDVLETLTHVTTALFDKTGTLTSSDLSIDDVIPASEHPHAVTSEQLLALVAALERHSHHPLANAFRDVTGEAPATDVRTIAGEGLTGTIGKRRLRIGSARFAAGASVSVPTNRAAIHVSDQDGSLGTVYLADEWRDDAPALIDRLRRAGIACHIVSGDRPERVAQAVQELGLDSGSAQRLPQQKLEDLRRRQRDGDVILAVGDGVNDAAFLAGADVSVAIASGAALAQAGADIVLTGRRLAALGELPFVARRVRAIVRQNLAWAIGYNVIAVPLAALGLIGPGFAALGMSLSSLVVVLNSARLARGHTAQAIGVNIDRPSVHVAPVPASPAAGNDATVPTAIDDVRPAA